MADCKFRTKRLYQPFPNYRRRGRRFCSRFVVIVADSLSIYIGSRSDQVLLGLVLGIKYLHYCASRIRGKSAHGRPRSDGYWQIWSRLHFVMVRKENRTTCLQVSRVLWAIFALYGCAESSQDAQYLSVSYEFFLCICLLVCWLGWGLGVGIMEWDHRLLVALTSPRTGTVHEFCHCQDNMMCLSRCFM